MTSRSLMDFIDAPVLVGDPEGRAVYVNPGFQRDFAIDVDQVLGMPLANLFEGGGREAVLRAVAHVCAGKPSASFRLRVGDRGYQALASPVEAEGGRVGVILLLTAEPAGDGRLQTFRREILDSLDDLAEVLAHLAEQTGGRRSERYRILLADGVRAVERMRKWADSVAARLGRDTE